MLAIGCMFALRFALPSARNKALMGRLGVGLRVVVGGCGRWRLHAVYRLHVCFACLVLSYCPLGHYAVIVIFPTGKSLSFSRENRYLFHRMGKPEGGSPEGGAGLVYTYRYVKKPLVDYLYLHVSVGACLSGCGCGSVS